MDNAKNGGADRPGTLADPNAQQAYRDGPLHHGNILLLPPNRVWRTYPGGKTLDALAGAAEPKDSHFAEDWIASVTAAKNAGREAIAEGVSQVICGGQPCDLKALLESDPEYFLGAAHVAKYGANPMLLVKFLDSAVRLHFQAHPTKEFARRFLGANSGKTEAYHILATRPGETEPFFLMGFQRPPAPEELKRIIAEQDMAAMERCFDRIPAKPGDTFLIPGGFPHALGGGVFMVEIQEPSDWVVRFEFEKAGYLLPEAARFMNRGVDFALSLLNVEAHSREEIERDYRCRPRPLRDLGPGSGVEELIGPDRTPCFRVRRARIAGRVAKSEAEFHVVIVTAGAVTVRVGGAETVLRTYEKYCVPAGLGPVELEPSGDGIAELLECYPPQ